MLYIILDIRITWLEIKDYYQICTCWRNSIEKFISWSLCAVLVNSSPRSLWIHCFIQISVNELVSVWLVSRYLLQYQEPIPCEQLVTTLCDIKQAYTQFGGTTLRSLLQVAGGFQSERLSPALLVFTGKRPFGVSLLYIGWDKHYGFQLYQSDPSGNYGGWKATCIGNNSAVSLKQPSD